MSNAKLKKLLQEVKEREGKSTKRFDVKEFCFSKQHTFVADKSKYKVACTSRRSGKTLGCIAEMLDTALNHQGCNVLYLTLSRVSAKRIVWSELKKVNKEYSLGGRINDSELTVQFPNGSTIYVTGAKDPSYIETFRGMSIKLTIIDEAQSFREYLRTLINDIITPATYDCDGRIIMTGTPGPIPRGVFYEAYHNTGEFQGWSQHHWTMMDNPWFKIKTGKEPADILKEELQKKNMREDDPTHLRENLGRWVEDLDALVFKYSPSRNHYLELPKNKKWYYIMGIDTGYEDSDAIAVLAYSHQDPNVYLVEEILVANQGWDALADQIRHLNNKYGCTKRVIDYAAGAKKFVEDFRKRYGIKIENADKHRKVEFIDLLNTDLRAGRVRVLENSQISEDWTKITWDVDKSTNAKRVISDDFHSDIADAFLYAWRECKHFVDIKEKALPSPHDSSYGDYIEEREMEEFRQQQEEEQWDNALYNDFGDF